MPARDLEASWNRGCGEPQSQVVAGRRLQPGWEAEVGAALPSILRSLPRAGGWSSSGPLGLSSASSSGLCPGSPDSLWASDIKSKEPKSAWATATRVLGT